MFAFPFLMLAACASDIDTRIVFRDPARVSIEVLPAPQPGSVTGAVPNEVLLDEGRMPTGEQSASDYRVTAIREPSGDLTLRWDTRLTLVGGELQRLTPADHTYVLAARPERVVSTGNALRIEQCATLSARYVRGGGQSGYAPTIETPIGDYDPCLPMPGRVRYTLVTPWSNVAEITETRSPSLIGKGAAIVLLPVTLPAIGGGTYLLARPHSGTPARIGGGLLVAAGLGLEIPFLPSLFGRTHKRRIPVPAVVLFNP